ncbi:unnamed protein product [Prunus armeniaca]
MDTNPFPPPATMTGTDRGQTGGIIQTLKKRKNTGRKFCPGQTEWSTGLTTSNQNKGEIRTLSML